jgi:hypothetical protein
MFRGALMYFPAALAALAKHSYDSNEKHNPGEPMHHARGKSMDHSDCIMRHLVDLGDMLAMIERGVSDADTWGKDIGPAVLKEATALFWRAGALSQELHERFGGAPLAPAARLPANTAAVDAYAEQVTARTAAEPLRCDARDGMQCALIAGHDGPHRVAIPTHTCAIGRPGECAACELGDELELAASRLADDGAPEPIKAGGTSSDFDPAD